MTSRRRGRRRREGAEMKFSNCNGGISGGPAAEPRKTIVTSSNIAGYVLVRSGDRNRIN